MGKNPGHFLTCPTLYETQSLSENFVTLDREENIDVRVFFIFVKDYPPRSQPIYFFFLGGGAAFYKHFFDKAFNKLN